ncbi:MFS transporter [Saccharibacillus sacchari]|uniref:MFS transporter n=1 Tax=Saccharibacillus sacchari TaxID=456493 RepID=UPI0004AFB30E|nr:MFS transporter [Saccharibacillus sacchari]
MQIRSRWLMISIGLGIMLNPLNSSMVAVAIPGIQQAFGLDYTTVSWIIFSFYISSAVAQPVMGKASDLFGRRRIFLAGLVVAFIASLLAPLYPSFGWLIALRIVQSIGTSMMVAVGMAIARVHIVEKQSAALAILSIFLSGAGAIGPFFGGLLTSSWGWEAIFFVNVPVALLGFILAWKNIPEERSTDSASSLREWLSRIDLPGILLFTAGLVTLFVGLLSIEKDGRIEMAKIVLVGIGLLLLLIFAVYELRISTPFIPLRLFLRYPAITRVNMEFMLANLLFYAVFFGLPSYLQQIRGINELHTGILMLNLGLCSLAVSPLAGIWVGRHGAAPILRTSALMMVFGSAGMAVLQPDSGLATILLILAAFGLANGLNGVAMQAALFAVAPKEVIGVASGLFNAFRYLGTVFSSLLTGLVMSGSFNSGGFRVLGILLFSIALLLTILGLPKHKSIEHP